MIIAILVVIALWLLYALFLIVGVPEPILNRIIVILAFGLIGAYISEKLDYKD